MNKRIFIYFLFISIILGPVFCYEQSTHTIYVGPGGIVKTEGNLSEAVKEYQIAKQKIDEIRQVYTQKIKFMSSVSDKIMALVERNQLIIEQKTLVQQKYLAVRIAADAMSEAYKKLSESYEEYGVSGDPVKLSDGSFVANYNDFEAQDYLKKFSLSRKYKSDNGYESFGVKWICSLDSRIIRLEPDSIDDCLNFVRDEIPLLEDANNILINLKRDWPGSSEIDEYMKEIAEEKENATKLIEVMEEESREKQYLKELNKYVSYGNFVFSSSYSGSSDFLIYLDENGNKYVFQNNGYGVWNSLSIINAPEIIIYADDKHIENGYQVVYKNGITKYFSKYGILEKLVDRNGNEELYFSEKGKINAIQLKTGELISIKRNGVDMITEISGPVSGTTTYCYDGALLKGVKDTSDFMLTYEYDSRGYLSKIKKADGKAVSINYNYSNTRYRYLCDSIIDENGNKEYFEYKTNNEILHYTSNGSKEVFRLNSLGNTIYKLDSNNNETLFSIDGYGIIKSESKNGFIRNFKYNSKYELISVSDNNGGVENFEYNNFGFVTRHTDSDGFDEAYDYDVKGNIINTRFCGNIISSIEYYPNGLIKKVTEDNRTVSYEYNQFGSVSRRIESNSDFGWENKDERWIYDNLNRISKYSLNSKYTIEYEYKKNTYGTYDVYENQNNRKSIIYRKDVRNRVIQIEETDLQNGIKYVKRNNLDGKGNITGVFINDVLIADYKYLPDGKLKSYEVWDNCINQEIEAERKSILTEYCYSDYGYITSVVRNDFPVQKNEYVFDNYRLKVKNQNYGSMQRTFEYDNRHNLVKETSSDGYWKKTDYSKAGRKIKITDSRGNQWEYFYKTDGTVSVVKTDFNQNKEEYFYNEKGLLIRSVKGKVSYSFLYDSSGNLVEKSGPMGCIKSEYDVLERKISEKIFDTNGNLLKSVSIIYDDGEAREIIKIGNEIYKSCKYDVWNRIIEEDGSEGRIKYEYDFLGNCISKQNQKGKKIEFEYSADGNLCLILYPDGRKIINTFLPTGEVVSSKSGSHELYSAEYNDEGNLQKFHDYLGNLTKLSYDSNNLISGISSYDTGLKKIRISNGTKSKVEITDELGNAFTSFVDNNGNIVEEINQFGKKAFYQYDEMGNVVKQNSFSGKSVLISNDYLQGIKETSFQDGTYKITKQNILGNYEYLKNSDSDLDYFYNDNGLLKKISDKRTQVEVNYSYDKYGRCIRKYNDVFDFTFSYDELGRLQKIADGKSKNWFSYLYDEDSYEESGSYRLSERKDSNGNSVLFGYNSNGYKIYTVVKSKSGDLLNAEIVFYDKNGRVSTIVREDGSFQKFNYDSKGRLEKAVRKWDEDYKSYYIIEAEDCGINNKNQKFAGKNIYLSEEEKTVLRQIANNLNLKTDFKSGEAQYSWEESYSYNGNGCLITLTNPVAKFIYEYDSMNRLISKHGVTSRSSGKSFFWDDDGNLIKIEGHTGKRVLTYGAINRPVNFREVNFKTGEESVIEYSYDALGRLISETVNGQNSYGYIYDGFSNNVILVTALMKNGNSVTTTLTKSREVENTYTTNNDFRVISGGFSAFDENIEEEKTELLDRTGVFDLRPYAVLSVGNNPLEIVYIENKTEKSADSKTLYRGLISNNVIACDSNGILTDFAECDIWGNTIFNGKYNIYGNSITRLRGENVMFDFGQRTYFPEMNSFSTQDPARADFNWFGYSVCDPVNFGDKGGLFKEGLTEAEKAEYASIVCQFAKYDSTEMQQNGEWNGMPIDFNCTEVTSYIDYYANAKMGIESSSEMCKNFASNMNQNNTKAAADSVCSQYIYSDKEGKNAIQTSDKLSDLSNPEIVTPGTVLVWGADETVKTGHTMTVLARSFDEEGNVTGITYIEGHLKISKLAEIGYCSVDGSNYEEDISMWMGKYQGTYELYGANTKNSCIK